MLYARRSSYLKLIAVLVKHTYVFVSIKNDCIVYYELRYT